MLLNPHVIYMTRREERMAERVVDFGNYSSQSIFSKELNHLLNNFAPLLYGKFPF